MQKTTVSLPEILRETWGTLRHRATTLLLGMLLFAAIALALRGLATIRVEQFRHGILVEDSVVGDLALLDALEQQQLAGDTDVESEIRAVRSRLSLQLSMLAGQRSLWELLRSPYFLFDVGPFLLISLLANFFSLASTFLLGILSVRHAEESLRTLINRIVPLVPGMLLLGFLLLVFTGLFVPALYIFVARAGIALPFWLTGSLQVLLIFVGYFVAILLGPRMALSPVILTDLHHARAALWRSVDSSRGYWGLVLQDLLLLSAALLILFFIVMTLVREFIGLPFLLATTRMFLFHLIALLMGVFLAHLTTVIEKHPIKLRLR